MPKSHDIAQDTWEHARRALVFFFERRGLPEAEDLAQETLMALWRRGDYEFSREEDFLRVCHGFAHKVLHQGYREAQAQFLDGSKVIAEVPWSSTGGLRGAEVPAFLRQVHRTGETRLRKEEWDLIKNATSSDQSRGQEQQDPAAANRLRVQLHRARRKLALLTGWKRH